MHLTTSTNEDGFNQALHKTWRAQELKLQETPVKSSLSEARDKLSFHFFKDIYESDLKRFEQHRKTFRGFYLYAVDGDDLNLPCSKDILHKGYRGRLFAKDYETHYPKMYTTFAFDILNGIAHQFSFSSKHQELKSALEFITNFERNSITIYDRLYGCYATMSSHLKHGSHFVIRMKSQGDRLPKALQEFIRSGKTQMIADWSSAKSEGATVRVRLVKVITGQKKAMYFATSLSEKDFSIKEIAELYQKRWSIETSFRDLTCTLKAEQWHAKKVNGILQEIYTLLWFKNAVSMQLRSMEKVPTTLKENKYSRSNFKLCAKIVISHIALLIQKKTREFMQILMFWIHRSLEKRKRNSRSYKRVVKGKQSKFPIHSKVPRRPTP